MERALANGQYKDGQLPETLGPFNGGRKRHGVVAIQLCITSAY